MIYTTFNVDKDEYYLESSNSEKILLKINDIVQSKISKKLIHIINKLNLDISTTHQSGNNKNTRQLGKQLILSLPYNEVLELKNTNNKKSINLSLDFKEIERGEIVLKGDFAWSRIVINEKNYEFGEVFESKSIKSLIYRWTISNEKEMIFYIGETKQFSKRVYQYLNPGKDQKTNMRINEQFKEYIAIGYKINLDILNLNNIFLNENTLDELELKEYRRLFENYFILKAKHNKYKVLNK